MHVCAPAAAAYTVYVSASEEMLFYLFYFLYIRSGVVAAPEPYNSAPTAILKKHYQTQNN